MLIEGFRSYNLNTRFEEEWLILIVEGNLHRGLSIFESIGQFFVIGKCGWKFIYSYPCHISSCNLLS